MARIFLAVRALYEKEGGKGKESLMALQWNYAQPLAPSLEEVAREVNGRDVATGAQVPGFAALQADGSTSCGNWIYSGSWTEAGNQMARRGQEDPTGLGLFPNYAWSWPANRRILYNRASNDADGKPWSEAPRLHPLERRQVDGRHPGLQGGRRSPCLRRLHHAAGRRGQVLHHRTGRRAFPGAL
jgi:hypothetical protein